MQTTRTTPRPTYLQAAAHFHATLHANACSPDLPGADCVAWADEHWREFLDQATVELGRALEDRDRGPEGLRLIFDTMEVYTHGQPQSDQHPSARRRA